MSTNSSSVSRSNWTPATSGTATGEAGRSGNISQRQRVTLLFATFIGLMMLTRLPYTPHYLYSFDSVNFAFALDKFDPTRNQPQPPGYPFYVAEEKLFSLLLGTPERTFTVLGSLIGGTALGFLYLLGRRMFSPWAGAIAAALLFVNPAFWFSTLTSGLRPHLALVSIVVGYFCWRAAAGESRYFYAASLALGLGSGFRPELLVMLFPLWIWTGWQCRSMSLFVRGFAIAAACVLLWFGVLVVACGGLAQMVYAFFPYLFTQTQATSILLDPRSSTWLHWVTRAFIWSGIGVVPWIWAVPFGLKLQTQIPDKLRKIRFLALWFLPAFIFFLTVHIGEPDHALSAIPVLCLAGGFCIYATEEMLAPRLLASWQEHRGILVWFAIIGNMLLFFGRFSLPQRDPSQRAHGLQSLTDAILFGTYETSYAHIDWVDQMARLSINQIRDLKTSTDRPLLLLSARDAEPSWRKMSYYFPSEKVYSLDELGDPAVPKSMAQLWLGSSKQAEYTGAAPIQVPVPKGARLVWLIAPASVEGLRRVIPLKEASPLYYTDLPPDFASFRWGSFEFVPQ